MYAERKIGDKWETIGHLRFMHRNYELFTWLGCQLRKVPVGPFAGRSWPEDSPYWTPPKELRWGDWGNEGFSRSWVSVRELITTEIPEQYQWFVEDVLKETALDGCDPDATRVLFEFDN